MERVAVIGTGVIGGGIAVNLLRAGHDVVVWNRSDERAAGPLAAGAERAATPAEAASGADVVFEATIDDESSRSVWFGDDGILAAAPAPTSAVTVATLTPAWVAELAVACAAAGCTFLDVPVTGGRAGAESGNLVMLAGGAADDLEAISGVLDAVSSQVFHFGPVGAGTAFKLVLNALQAMHLASFGEAMRLVRAAGLDEQFAGELLVERVGGRLTTMAWNAYREPPATANFALSLGYKDLRYAAVMAGDVPSPMLDAALASYADADARGLGDRDWAVIGTPPELL